MDERTPFMLMLSQSKQRSMDDHEMFGSPFDTLRVNGKWRPAQ